MNQTSPVKFEMHGAVARIVLNRGDALNSINETLAQAFLSACQQASENASVRAVVLCSEGTTFGVGGDLASLRDEPALAASRLIRPMHSAVKILTSMSAPVVVALHGRVAGGSLSLALNGDFVLISEDARLNLAYANVGASCDVGASWYLPRLVGLRQALEIALLSKSIDAAEALRLNLVNAVVPADSLQERTMELATRLASGPTQAFGEMKRLMRSAFERDLSSQLDEEEASFLRAAQTSDFAEATSAFFEKRPALFKGV